MEAGVNVLVLSLSTFICWYCSCWMFWSCLFSKYLIRQAGSFPRAGIAPPPGLDHASDLPCRRLKNMVRMHASFLWHGNMLRQPLACPLIFSSSLGLRCPYPNCFLLLLMLFDDDNDAVDDIDASTLRFPPLRYLTSFCTSAVCFLHVGRPCVLFQRFLPSFPAIAAGNIL